MIYNYMKKINEKLMTKLQRACRDAIKKGRSPIAKRDMGKLRAPTKIEGDSPSR